jgi:hypothetical protein
MIKILNIITITALFLISCGKIGESHLWVNFYDPEKDSEKRAEICGEKECGSVDHEGFQLICGECTGTEYCSVEQKCIAGCGENSCGTYDRLTYSGYKAIDCGKCTDGYLCGTSNTCTKEENICSGKECGHIMFTDYLNVQHKVVCGECEDDEYCGTSLKCSAKADECAEKCGTITVLAFEGDIDVECSGCEGEFAYCNTGNTCAEACQEKECGTHKVTLDSLLEKTFTCGNCGDGNNYCDTGNKCKVACTDKECGTDEVETFSGFETFECGSCTIPEYCDSTQSCKAGTQAGDAVYDENIVIDTKTDLMWQRSNSDIMTLEAANTHCATAQTDGFTDWTLPDISKLKTIVSGCTATQTCDITDTCTESTCTNADCNGCTNNSGAGPQGLYLAPDIWTYSGDANGRFWSSSSTPDKADSYWFIRFSNASVAYNFDGTEYFVRCVREIK